MERVPAVSVIIPLYNAEKYIGECLESVLNQTFQNFEVIVVDDCSTDESPAIVESYLEKFGGRLNILSMEKNSGCGALPRNKGMRFSRGEYISFLDNDDLITPTALEELYTLAKKYDADVVYCENNYRIYADGSGLHKKDFPGNLLVEKPTFEPENFPERVQRILQGKYRPPQWLKFVRRSLIFEHALFFPNTRPSDDDIWTYALVFYARKFLRVPNLTHIYRLTEDSIMRKKKTPQQEIKFWLNPVFFGLKSLDNFLGKLEFFQTNPQYRYALLERFLNIEFYCTWRNNAQFPAFAVYETIKQNFGENFGEHDALISALCTAFIVQQKNLYISHQNYNQFAAQAQGRIAELEKRDRENKAYIAELEKYIINLNRKE